MIDVRLLDAALITAAGTSPADAFDNMIGSKNLFRDPMYSGDVTSFTSLWPFAAIDSEHTKWPDDEAWWANRSKYANRAARLTAAAAQRIAWGALPERDPCEVAVVVAAGDSAEELFDCAPDEAIARANSKNMTLAGYCYEEIPDFTYLKSIPSIVGQFVAHLGNASASNVAVLAEAGAGGLAALSLAVRMIRRNEINRVIIVAGSPLPSLQTAAYFDIWHKLSSKAELGAGPYGPYRSGSLIGESGVAMVLERGDGLPSTVRGSLPVVDACNVVASKSAESALRSAMAMTLRGRVPQVWWTGASGAIEYDRLGMDLSFERDNFITSSKGTLGLSCDCSGLVDVVLAAEGLKRNIVPPVGLIDGVSPEFAHLNICSSTEVLKDHLYTSLVTCSDFYSPSVAGAAFVMKDVQNA